MGAEHGLAGVFSAAPEAILMNIGGEVMDDYCRGHMTEDEFWSRTCERNAWKGDIPAAKRALRDNMRVAVPGTEELLREVASRGSRAFLLSDHGREWIDDLLEVHDFFEVFERRFFSFDLGSIKTERLTFERVLSELGAPEPGSVFFADDRPANIETALLTGIDAVQFTNAAGLRRQLEERNLL